MHSTSSRSRGGTDAKYYAEHSDTVYRFFAGLIPGDDMAGFHGTNERLPVESLVVRRDGRSRRYVLEIVGFWTPDYLESKCRRLRAAGIDNLILCVDQARAAAASEDLPKAARVIPYRRWIDAVAVRAVIEGSD